MKLVDILARDLKEWPEEFPHAYLSQSVSGRVAYIINNKERFVVGNFEQAEDWVGSLVEKKEWEKAVQEQAPWTGDGNPPVGNLCEMTFDDGRLAWGYWVKTRVLCYGDTMVFVCQETRDKAGEWLEGSIKASGMKFRPLKTPEQVAAEEREAAIEVIRELLSNVACDDFHAAVAIYDAGYRKQEPKPE